MVLSWESQGLAKGPPCPGSLVLPSPGPHTPLGGATVQQPGAGIRALLLEDPHKNPRGRCCPPITERRAHLPRDTEPAPSAPPGACLPLCYQQAPGRHPVTKHRSAHLGGRAGPIPQPQAEGRRPLRGSCLHWGRLSLPGGPWGAPEHLRSQGTRPPPQADWPRDSGQQLPGWVPTAVPPVLTGAWTVSTQQRSCTGPGAGAGDQDREGDRGGAVEGSGQACSPAALARGRQLTGLRGPPVPLPGPQALVP